MLIYDDDDINPENQVFISKSKTEPCNQAQLNGGGCTRDLLQCVFLVAGSPRSSISPP